MPEPAVYLDHAATTPLTPKARDAWLTAVEALSATPGNPNALHFGGRAARAMLEDARERLADALGCERTEVIFTSGATEAVALGVVGGARAVAASRPRSQASFVLGSGIDHPAVLEQKEPLARHGIGWENLRVGRDGVTVVSKEAIEDATERAAMTDRGEGEAEDNPPQVALATLGLVCSETGVIQPVGELAEEIALTGTGALVHTDATQAVGNIPFSFADLGVDLLSIGGHKFGATVGTGALVAKRTAKLFTDRPGGGQERKLRSGTQDVAGALSLSVAAQEAVADLATRTAHYTTLRDHLVRGLPRSVTLTSDAPAAPSIVHLSLPTAHPEVLLMEMDRQRICVSAGSACHAGVTRPSAVLLAMGASQEEALGVLRVSFGPQTEVFDVDRFLAALPTALERANQMDQYDALP